MTHQLEIWKGEFGKEYTNRCVVNWQSRLPAFREMLSGLNIGRALEIGCNRGHNLIALSQILTERGDIVGIEPNRYAIN